MWISMCRDFSVFEVCGRPRICTHPDVRVPGLQPRVSHTCCQRLSEHSYKMPYYYNVRVSPSRGLFQQLAIESRTHLLFCTVLYIKCRLLERKPSDRCIASECSINSLYLLYSHVPVRLISTGKMLRYNGKDELQYYCTERVGPLSRRNEAPPGRPPPAPPHTSVSNSSLSRLTPQTTCKTYVQYSSVHTA